MTTLAWFGRMFLEYLRNVAPLALVLVLVRVFALRAPIDSIKQFIILILTATLGLFLFIEGCRYSLFPLGRQVGEDMVNVSKPAMLAIACLIGFAATLVEPALIETARSIDEQSAGALSRNVLIGVTAVGVAAGMVLGVGRIIYGIGAYEIMLPMLALLLVLGYFAGDAFSAFAFDCASATTGPVNIPVNLAIAIGLASRLEGVDPIKAGFGIVGLTCLGAATAVMLYGVIAGRGAQGAF